MKKVCLITLGCPKNIVEGETIAGLFKSNGFKLTTNLKNTDYCIIHTCSFISDARQESEHFIKIASEYKKSGRIKRLVVSGCLVESEGKKLKTKFPLVNGFIGTGHLDRLPDAIKSDTFIYGKPGGLLESGSFRLLSSFLPSAYLRISEGCNHKCSFCLIPRTRGIYKSRTIQSIFREAEKLSASGIKEIILVSQDTTSYGLDLYGYYALPDLLKKLNTIKNIKWIRLLYCFPNSITKQLIEIIKKSDKICKYVDIPLQHVNKNLLNLMGRPLSSKSVIQKLLDNIPDLFLRTTFIVGFPYENENSFNELYYFVSQGWFYHMGVFEYSSHPELKSEKLKNKVNDEIAKLRRKRLMLLQKRILNQKNSLLVGSYSEAIIEYELNKKNGYDFIGRTEFQAPEIDNKIFLKGKSSVGSFVKVKITGHKGYDLLGRIISNI